jgi:acyl carrier protein
METASPVQTPRGGLREEVRAAVKEIIASIKMIEGGPGAIADDALLISDGLSEPSELELDSLDALDLALALKERFDPEGNRFEAFLEGEVDMQALGTVTKITDYVLSQAATSTNGHSVAQAGAADERVRPVYH